MTKKDYCLIARGISNARYSIALNARVHNQDAAMLDTAVDSVVSSLTAELQRANVKFNSVTFIKACKL